MQSIIMHHNVYISEMHHFAFTVISRPTSVLLINICRTVVLIVLLKVKIGVLSLTIH